MDVRTTPNQPMNIKTLGLGLLTTLATVTTPALAGYEVQGYHLMDGTDFGPQNEAVATQIIDDLTEMGIPVLDGGKNDVAHCEHREDGSQTLGFYVPSDDFMVVCTDGIDTDLQMETLVHETVHVIQDARDGIDNGSLVGPEGEYLQAVVNALHPQKANLITTLYDREDWEIEAEAFLFETEGQEVATELAKWVF